jgi:prephenate dehydrogenase
MEKRVLAFQEKPKVAIIGLGLLGTSLAMALNPDVYHRLGWARRTEVREWCINHKIIDETADGIEDILFQADITVLCLPIPEIIHHIEYYASAWRPGAVITDVGSVKRAIVDLGETILAPRGIHFVGSHPMAGTEKSGHQAAFPTLYQNAEVFVTTTKNSNPEALNKVASMWQSIKTDVVIISTEHHDIIVAYTSHLSHIMALALTQVVLDCPENEFSLRYSGCASGFRDTSRIASSSPKMWREIIENNRSAVLSAVTDAEKRLCNLRQIISSGEFDKLESEFSQGKLLRDNWIKYKNNKIQCI